MGVCHVNLTFALPVLQSDLVPSCTPIPALHPYLLCLHPLLVMLSLKGKCTALAESPHPPKVCCLPLPWALIVLLCVSCCCTQGNDSLWPPEALAG